MNKGELRNYLKNISSEAKDLFIFTLIYGGEEGYKSLSKMVKEFNEQYILGNKE